MKTDKNKHLFLIGACAAALLPLGAAQNLTVATSGEASETDAERVVVSPYVHGDSMTGVTKDAAYGSVTVHGTLVVTSNLYANAVYLGKGEGDDACLRIDGVTQMGTDKTFRGGKLITSSLVIGEGGGQGYIHRKNSVGDSVDTLTLSSAATTAAETFTVFSNTVNNGFFLFSLGQFVNNNDKPARFLFCCDDNEDPLAYGNSKSYGLINAKNYNAALFSLPNEKNEAWLESPSGDYVSLRFQQSGGRILAAGDKGRVRVRSGGHVYISSYSTGAVVFESTNVVWEKLGHLVLRCPAGTSIDNYPSNPTRGSLFRTDVDDALPWGANAKHVYVCTYNKSRERAYWTALDLNGHSQKVNGLILHEGFLTNSAYAAASSAEAVVTFGTAGQDGVFAGDGSAEGVRFEKVGTGTLVVSNAVAGAFTALGGTIRVPAGTTFSGKVFAATNVNLVVDGALDFETYAIDAASAVSGNTEGGATNVVTSIRPFCSENVFRKVGADYLTATLPEDGLGSGIRVEGGTLRLGGTLCTNDYWRMTVKKTPGGKVTGAWTNGEISVTLAFPHVGLFDGSGLALTRTITVEGNGKRLADGSDPSGLLENGLVSAKPNFKISNSIYTKAMGSGTTNPFGYGASYDRLIYVLGDTNAVENVYDTQKLYYWWAGACYANEVPVENDSATWETIAWRIPSGTDAAASYNCAPGTNFDDGIQATSWLLESSPSGAEGTWVTMDEQHDVAVPADRQHYSYNGHVPYLFNAFSNTWKFTTFGFVQVDAGAVLDLSSVPRENIAVNGLRVDLAADAGTIRRFVPAEAGTIDLVLADGQELKPRVNVPLAFEDASSLDRLTAWKVTVNGVARPKSFVTLKDGKIVVRTPHGLLFVIR